jgi:hypothetical protein
MNISVQFKDKEIFNSDDFTFSNLSVILINDITFNLIIYIWYLIFIFGGVTTINPFFALITSFIFNIGVFLYMLYKKTSKANIIKYFILLIILKIFPLISLYLNDKIYINYIDVYTTAYLYIIYILVFFIIYDIILKKNSNVMTDIIYKDLKTDIQTENDKSLISSIYDTTYNDIIKQII